MCAPSLVLNIASNAPRLGIITQLVLLFTFFALVRYPKKSEQSLATAMALEN